jgi:hypothetical protein
MGDDSLPCWHKVLYVGIHLCSIFEMEAFLYSFFADILAVLEGLLGVVLQVLADIFVKYTSVRQKIP